MKEIRVVRAIIHHDGKILLLKKAKDTLPYNKDKWEVPGGKIEEGEDIGETLKRELKEEIGLELGKDVMLEKQLKSCQGEAEGVRSFAEVFLLKAKTNQITLSGEHSEYVWKMPEEIKNMDLVLFADLLLDYLKKLSEEIL